MMAWQPIETAPKRKRILFYWLEGLSGSGFNVEIGDCVYGEYYDVFGSMFLSDPTHWMLWPDPPKEKP